MISHEFPPLSGDEVSRINEQMERAKTELEALAAFPAGDELGRYLALYATMVRVESMLANIVDSISRIDAERAAEKAREDAYYDDLWQRQIAREEAERAIESDRADREAWLL